MKHNFSATLLLLLASLFFLPIGNAASTWRPLTDTRNYNDVWMASATEGWAVGEVGLISHTTDGGATWENEVSGVTVTLNGIWGASSTSIWAVGEAGTVLRWNGTSWSPQISGVTVDLYGVHGIDATTLWAVGATATIIKYDGIAWAVQSVPGTNTNSLRGVWAANATNIWAVGIGGRILKGNGTTWASQANSSTNDLYAIWGTSPTNLMAVGEAGTVRVSNNGNTWAAGAASGIAGNIFDVHGTSASSIWVVGAGGAVAFYNGSSFGSQTSNTTVLLNGMFAASNTSVIAVGVNRVRTRFNGTAWTAISSGLPAGAYYGTWATDDDSVWFVGAGGRAMRWNGSTFTSGPATGVNDRLNDVWGLNNQQVWAVGNAGTIIEWNGTSWAEKTSSTTQNLAGCHGTSPTDVWAVGATGTILHYNGTAWTPKTSPTTQTLNAVWAASPTLAWAVGNAGVIIKWNGSTWAVQASTTTRNLSDVQGFSSTAIWAVGAGGTILKYSGSAWAAQVSGTSVALTSVSVLNSTDAWVAGANVVRRSSGTSWIADGSTGYPKTIEGLTVTGVNTAFLACTEGMAFTNSPLTVPQIEVTRVPGVELLNNRTVDMGGVILANQLTQTFTITSKGNTDLTGLTLTKSGSHAADFTVTPLSVTTLAAGNSTTFDVTFKPSVATLRTAALRITSNDHDEASLNLPLSGVGQLAVGITTQPLSRQVNPGTNVIFTVKATGTAPILYQWQKYNTSLAQFENIANAKLSSYTITSANETHQGDYRVIVNNLPISTATSATATLNVNDTVVISAAPVSKTVAVGDPVSFDATVSGEAPLKYQWRQNGASLAAPLGTAVTYSLSSAQLVNAGDITVTVSNMVTSKTSTPAAAFTVIDTGTKVLKLPAGATAKITAPYAGKINGTFVWKRNGGPLPSDPRFTFSKNVLTITKLQIAPTLDSDTYTCDITGMDGVTNTTRTDLVVYTDKPEILGAEPLDMGQAMVGDPTYTFTIPVNAGPLLSPTKYTASPLPTGLLCNAITGQITGRPAVSITADKIYLVTLTASNAKGSVSKKGTLILKPMFSGSIGTFTGPIVRQSVLNNGLGGRFDLTSSAAGSFTGKITLGAVAHSFSGKWTTDLDGVGPPVGVAFIKRTAPLPQLTVSFTSDVSNNAITLGDITDGTEHATFTAWKRRWGTLLTPLELEDLNRYKGYYTFGMDPPVPPVVPPITPAEVLPQGMGYGYFTVGSTGALTAIGKLPDGTAYSSANFCGPTGQVLVFRALYSNKGSLHGTLDIEPGTSGYDPPYGDNTIPSATLTWNRPPVTGTIYKLGFAATNLTVTGGRYVPPLAPALLFGVTDNGVDNNATLVFSDGGILGTSTDVLGTFVSPNISARIKAKAAVTVPVNNPNSPPNPNPRSTTLSINGTTGTFTGKFTLIDTNPAVLGTNITRATSYYGIIFRDTPTTLRGYGFFQLSRRPDVGSTQKVTTTDKLTGQVALERIP